MLHLRDETDRLFDDLLSESPLVPFRLWKHLAGAGLDSVK